MVVSGPHTDLKDNAGGGAVVAAIGFTQPYNSEIQPNTPIQNQNEPAPAGGGAVVTLMGSNLAPTASLACAFYPIFPPDSLATAEATLKGALPYPGLSLSEAVGGYVDGGRQNFMPRDFPAPKQSLRGRSRTPGCRCLKRRGVNSWWGAPESQTT